MISYDTNVLIYALEGNDELAHAALDVIKLGHNDGAVLPVSVKQELLTGPLIKKSANLEKLSAAFDEITDKTLVPITDEIIKILLELTGRFGKKLYGYDAINIATAMYHGAHTYYTNDRQLLELKVPGIHIQSLD